MAGALPEHPKRGPTKKGPRIIPIRITPELDELFVYAESQGLRPSQAAAELLVSALHTNARDAVYIAAARHARGEAQRIVFTETLTLLGKAWRRVEERAVELGIDFTISQAKKDPEDPR